VLCWNIYIFINKLLMYKHVLNGTNYFMPRCMHTPHMIMHAEWFLLHWNVENSTYAKKECVLTSQKVQVIQGGYFIYINYTAMHSKIMKIMNDSLKCYSLFLLTARNGLHLQCKENFDFINVDTIQNYCLRFSFEYSIFIKWF